MYSKAFLDAKVSFIQDLQQTYVKDTIYYANLANDVLLQILLYGDKNFPNNLDRSILELAIRFIHSTGRFE